MSEISDQKLGYAVASEWSGITVLLDSDIDVETLRIGSYAVVQGTTGAFLCMVSDVRTTLDRSSLRGPLTGRAIATLRKANALVAEMKLKAYMMRPNGSNTFGPVSSVPGHLRTVGRTDQDMINGVFAAEASKTLAVGTMIDMPDVWINLDLPRLAARSACVVGASGTGKSFLARIILAGMIQNKVAANLIFDMHNEYGWESENEQRTRVKGLKQLFPDGRVSVFSLDPESAQRRQAKVDFFVRIGYDKVEPEDIEALQISLGLSDVMVGAVYALASRLDKKTWLRDFLNDAYIDNYGLDSKVSVATQLAGDVGMKALATDTGQPLGTLQALRRRLREFKTYEFLVDKADDDVTDRIMRYLDAGNSVVLEFGRYGNDLSAYIFVANFLTRRIHEQYVKRMESSFGSHAAKPTPLIITIEEAHKFLDPAIAKSTIFGTIAREMRKYNVTLFVIDQMPSQIDKDVMAQIQTRFAYRMTNEDDIRAIFSGVEQPDGLRAVLSRLETIQDVLMFGHALPLPVAVRTRTYGVDFYKAMGYRTDAELAAVVAVNVRKMRGEESEGFD